ncbi:hypothetical protein LshimejAT787_1403260 [Lyophyllum shimeji]|uniref:Uncharacterized protein n=1 Tax=Lyophyllum shimeji TaxID=47721 RepID=A0A9P3PYH6_LYOSH|nr:hypothetical protein LshimejAT787_1403260 [Lyophyllum shimeji]
MSSSSSIRSYHSSRSQIPTSYRTAYETDATPTASSFTDDKPKSEAKARFPFGFGFRALSPRPDIHIHPAHSDTPRPSVDSASSSSSGRSWLDLKERKVPPPLHLNGSNLHPRTLQEPPVIEIVAPGPPRVSSRLSSYTLDFESPVSLPPDSPDFHMPSEEEIRRRRHEKVMRTLGERIPSELVNRGPKIPNVTVFPDPPSDGGSHTARRETTKTKLARRASFTLSSLPNLSSVTSALLPVGHGRSKSRDPLDSPVSTPSATPTPRAFPHRAGQSSMVLRVRNAARSHTHPRPQSIGSPIAFATFHEAASASRSLHAPSQGNSDDRPSGRMAQQTEAERAAKLARRASISTATFLPSSPSRDGFLDLDPPSPRSPVHNSYRPESVSLEPTVYVHARRPRPESMAVMSPLVFAKHTSFVAPSSGNFTFVIDDEEEPSQNAAENDDDGNTAGSRTPPQCKLKAESDRHGGLGTFLGTGSRSRSNPHLPLHVRPDTPFQDGVPLEGDSAHLAPPTTWVAVKEQGMIQRKERRQGWSGEWNQGDMQEVIKKLRNLK